MNGWELRARRRNAGLTAAKVARATGTSETNVAAYERGDKTPGQVVLERLQMAFDAGGESTIFKHNLLTAPRLASVIRAGLRTGWSQNELLRLVREHRSNAKFVTTPKDRALFFARPSTTGDQRWDAMIACSTADLFCRADETAPAWTENVRTPDWIVSDNPRFESFLRKYSPEPFKARGVFVDPASLDSV
jgi:transcriptional regulator with XRE-family HTH domain